MSTKEKRPLEMKFAGEFVKRLGLEMYSGPTPAIAELIANSWDADAGRVDVTVPFETPLCASSQITVTDSGTGMSYEDCNEKYLVIGRNRRKIEGEYSLGGRKIMAHKGIGKLAGFGIADIIEIQTVRSNELTQFLLDYKKIESLQRGETYHPEVLKAGIHTDSPDGTTITIRDIRLVNHVIHRHRFELGLARRFAVYSDSFRLYLNGDLFEKKRGVFTFKFPQPGPDVTLEDDWWGVEEIPDAGKVKWWIGFTRKPIEDDESRGVTVLVRGKLAQNPWFFELSGGMWGQFGQQYLTGEVQADFLDEQEDDLVSSDRQSILWELPKARELLSWGQTKILEALRKRADTISKENLKELKQAKFGERQETFLERIGKFPANEARYLMKAIDDLVKIETIGPEQLSRTVSDVLDIFEDANLRGMLSAISAASPQAQIEIFNIIREYSIIEAVQLAKVVKMHISVIEKFTEMIAIGVPEKPDMQEMISTHPWLIDPTWLPMKRERQLERFIADEFGIRPNTQGGKRFFDFICMADTGRIVVIELKRPQEMVGKKELRQIADYVDYVADNQEQISDKRRKRFVVGYLVGSKYEADAKREVQRMETQGIYTYPWDDVLRATFEGHRDFLDVVYSRAPKDDPRIIDLRKTHPTRRVRKRKAKPKGKKQVRSHT